MANADGSVLIAQITDTHVGFEPEAGEAEFNYLRFVMAIDHLLGQPVQPDVLLLTGDIADKGQPDSYERVKRLIARCPFPVHVMTGNHDHRDCLLEAFPDYTTVGGYLQYAIELDGLRLLCLDTLEHGRHGGAFCEVRAQWLAGELAAQPDTPTLIVMHHPPIAVGIAWMDPRPHEPWLNRFADTIRGHAQIVGIACGHLHRPIAATLENVQISITPAVAPAVSLDMRPVDFNASDGRGIVDEEPPGYALHRWKDGRLVTHFQPAGDWARLASFSDAMVPFLQKLDAERGQPPE